MVHKSTMSPVSAVLGLAAVAVFGLGNARATLIARDGFTYAAGSSLAGQTGPLGFGSAYTASNSGCTISSPGYTYGDLAATGNKLAFAGTTNNGNFGILTSSPDTPGTTIYFSYLMKVDPASGYAGVSLYEGATETLFTGKRSGTPNVFGMEPKVGISLNSTVTCSHLSLVVCRIDFAAASATVRMYVNPQSGVEPAAADLTVTRAAALTYDRVRFQGNAVVGAVDEFRLGNTFADAAPISYGSVPREVVVLGSSVAAGAGAATQSEAWAYRMENLLENQAPVVPGSRVAWQVENASIGGNNTTAVLNRFQADVADARTDANMVIIGLSLANEGLIGAANPQSIFDSFKSGISQIVARCRTEGFYPIITLCYPQNLYSAAEYGYVKRMNLLLNTWDVPCINLLGAIDDGAGHWASGYSADDGHPNSTGHGELFSAIVPSLFDAIVAGKTTQPQLQGTTGYLRLQRDAAVTAPLAYTPANPILSFNVSFRVRSTDVGSIAAIGSGASRATLEIRDNSFVYISPGGAEVSAALDANDGRWHDVALSHRHATGKSLLFIDGQLRGSVDDQYLPDLFTVGGAAGAAGRALAPLHADFQDLCIYRAAWTEDEALAQSRGALQQASMEICSPLADVAPAQGAALANRAQSFSQLTLQTANFTPMLAATTPDGLTAGSYASATVSLTWTDHANGATPFTIERRRTGIAEPWTTAGTSPGNSPRFEDSGLVAGTSYDYRVSTADGSLYGDYSNVVSIAPAGQSAVSYQSWIGGYFAQSQDTSVYLVDFNTNASPAYGAVKWNTVNSLNSTVPYPLSDSNNNPSNLTVAITNSFDQFRSDNIAPLAGYAAAAQNSQFGLRDDNPLTGAITFSGLDPTAAYDFSFFARRGSLAAGFDYTGTYTFTGSGAAVAVVVDGATSSVLTHVPPVTPSAAGTVTLTITAGPGAGTDFPVINFIQFKRSNPSVYLIDFNTNATPNYGTVKWNTVNSLGSTTPYPLTDTSQIPSGLTVAITDSFDQFRSDAIAPLAGYAAAAQGTQFALRDDVPLKGVITFAGLDPAKTYDFSFFARRGTLVAGFDYTGTYTFAGSGTPVVVTVDGATSAVLTNVPPVAPTAGGVVTLAITAGPGTGTDFPVINFIQLKGTAGTANGAKTDPNADPDGDGVSNFEEYARAFNPTLQDAAPFKVGSFNMNPSSTGVRLEFTRDRRARDAGYLLQKADDLTHWQTDTSATQSVLLRNGPAETLLFESPSAGPKQFYRIRLLDLTPQPGA